jgi:hypothetical protein
MSNGQPPPNVAAEDIENQIDWADVFQGVVLEVDELLRAEVEHRLTVGSASGSANPQSVAVRPDTRLAPLAAAVSGTIRQGAGLKCP